MQLTRTYFTTLPLRVFVSPVLLDDAKHRRSCYNRVERWASAVTTKFLLIEQFPACICVTLG